MRTPDPLAFAVAAAGLAVVTALLGLVLRRQLRRVASLRTAVLVLAASTLGIALVAALLATRLMLIEGRELRLFLVVLASAAGFAGLLAVVVSRSIASDVARLGLTAQRVEAGDLAARTGIERRDELGRAAHALDAMVARLDQLERERAGAEAERRTMLTSISHDLRTPLTAMRAAVEALADGVAPDPERYLTSMAHDLAALGCHAPVLPGIMPITNIRQIQRFAGPGQPVGIVHRVGDRQHHIGLAQLGDHRAVLELHH